MKEMDIVELIVEKDDIATTSIHETDMKQIPRMDARNNEVIREQFGE